MRKKGSVLIETLIALSISTLILSVIMGLMISEIKGFDFDNEKYMNSSSAYDAFVFIEQEINDNRVEDVVVETDSLKIKQIQGGHPKTYTVKEFESKLIIDNYGIGYNVILSKIHKVKFEELENMVVMTLWIDENHKEVKSFCVEKKVVY